MKSTWHTGSLAFKRRSGCSATPFSYCAGMKILSAAKLPSYQKSSMTHRVTWHLTVASTERLNGLENLQQVSEFYRYDALNLLCCMTMAVEDIHLVVHCKDQLFTVLDYPRNFNYPAREGLKRATH